MERQPNELEVLSGEPDQGLALLPVTVPPEEKYAALHELAERGREIERRRGPDPYPRPTGPPPTLDQLRRRRDEIEQLAARHRAATVWIFGSVARGDARPDSDLDVLVDLGGGPCSTRLASSTT